MALNSVVFPAPFGPTIATNCPASTLSVAVFAQGPIGLCATAGARLRGAALVIGIDTNEQRLAVARRLGANVTLNVRNVDAVAEIKRLDSGPL